MSDRQPIIADEEARAIWKRAGELQLGAESSVADPQGPSLDVDAGYSLAEVVEAAEEAGIDAQSVFLALAERRLPEAAEVHRERWAARSFHALVRGREQAIEAERRFNAPPDRVVQAFRAVVSQPAFELILEDRVGPDPLENGVMVFRIPDSLQTFHGEMKLADTRIVLLTARAERGGTLLRLRLPRFEQGLNLVLTGGLAGLFGTGGGYGGATLGGILAGTLGTASVVAMAAPAAAGALVGGALGVTGFRAVDRWGGRKGRTALGRLLQTVALEVESRGGADPEQR